MFAPIVMKRALGVDSATIALLTAASALLQLSLRIASGKRCE